MASRTSKTMLAGHTAGIFADMSLDGPEIGTLVAVVDRARNLPNRRTMGKQDPYCAMRLGKEAKKTETDRRGGQTPRWDQELRFTVHESPDYYKLKCSVFNDDKKTDLIGEAWIDLHEVIIPGGGQNDLWHQLSFKGKYAGDIRVELTYYDTRPEPSTGLEKKRSKDKASSSAADRAGTLSGARQLGPREIKRRPLPPQPDTQNSSTTTYQPHHNAPQSYSGGQNSPMQGQPTYLEPEFDQMRMQIELRHESESRRSLPHSNYTQEIPEYGQYPDDETYSFNSGESSVISGFSNQSHTGQVESLSSRGHSPIGQSIYPDEREIWDKPSSQISPYTIPQQSMTPPQHSSPSSRPGSQSSVSAAPQVDLRSRNAISPTKSGVFRDSPLRHSISQGEEHMLKFSASRHDNNDGNSPPPPPAHRASVPRDIPRNDIQFNSHQAQTQRTSFGRSPADRSPLQNIEQKYSPQQYAKPPDIRHTRPLPASPTPSANEKPRRRSQNDREPSNLDEQLPPPHRISPDHDTLFHGQPLGPIPNGATSPRARRHSKQGGFIQTPPKRAHTFDTYQNFDDAATYRSEPQIIRPRAVSPNPIFTTPRKSVSPQTLPMDSSKRMSGIPFGPDSYDVLNPGSSPVAYEPAVYTPPEYVKEQARQKEVEKLREQGPIIGNDGRVIDPSDHLPSDTWAPEPERKSRKPEHVIHIRSKEESRTSTRPELSPSPTRPTSMYSSPYGSSPGNGFAASTPNLSGGRNRLQKQMPARPLPAQPLLHTQTSPAVLVNPSSNLKGPSSQQNSPHNLPASPFAPRPSPTSPHETNSSRRQSTQGSYHKHHASTPSRPSHGERQYPTNSHYSYDDPLAAEMSTIDLGPSRGGKTALRSSQGYGMY